MRMKSDCHRKKIVIKSFCLPLNGVVEKEYICSLCYKPCTPVESEEENEDYQQS